MQSPCLQGIAFFGFKSCPAIARHFKKHLEN
jgi:hypothetical protein